MKRNIYLTLIFTIVLFVGIGARAQTTTPCTPTNTTYTSILDLAQPGQCSLDWGSLFNEDMEIIDQAFSKIPNYLGYTPLNPAKNLTDVSSLSQVMQNLGAVGYIVGSGTPNITCSASVNKGYLFINNSLNLYMCSNATGTYQWGDVSSSSGSNGTLNLTSLLVGGTGLGSAYLVPMPFSSQVLNVVGMAQDPNGNCYTISSYIQAFNCITGVAGATNTNPFAGLPSGTNHIGGGEVCGPSLNYLCIPAGTESGGSTFTNVVIAEYNLSNLTLATYFSVSAGSCDGSAVAYNVNTNNLLCASYYSSGATAELWNFTSQTLAGYINFSPALPEIQGISYDNVHNQYCAFTDQSSMTVGVLSSISNSGVVSSYPYNGGIIPFSGELEGGTCSQGALLFPAPTNGGIFAVVPGTGSISMTSDGVSLQSNLVTSPSTGLYSNTSSGIGFGSSQLSLNTQGVTLQTFPGQRGIFNQYSGYKFGLNNNGQVTMPGGFGINNYSAYLYGTHYGVAWDGTYLYGVMNGAITKYLGTSPWTVLSTNSSAYTQMNLSTNNIKDLEYSGGNLYVPGTSNGSVCSGHGTPVYSGPTIGVFVASTLLPVGYTSTGWTPVLGVNYFNLSGGIQAPTGVAINATGNLAYVVDYCDATELYSYNLPSWSFAGVVPLSSNISGLRGISYNTTSGNLMAVNGNYIYTLTTAGKILTQNLSPITTGSPEGVDANYGTAGIITQNSILYSLTGSSCCGLQVYGVPISSPISAGDIPVSAGAGELVDSMYGIPQLSANTWTPPQTFVNNMTINPTTSTGSSNLNSNNLNFGVWTGACAIGGHMYTGLSSSMGSGSAGSFYFGIAGPSTTTMSTYGCTGSRFLNISNFDQVVFGSGSSPILMDLYESPKIYLTNGGGPLTFAAPVSLVSGATVNVANGTTTTVAPLSATPTGNCVGYIDSSGVQHGCVADVSLSVPSFAIPANTCYGSSSSTTPTTVTMTGVTTSMAIVTGFSGNPTSLTGWGSTGGLNIAAWPSSANTVSYLICNSTGSSITGSAITFTLGAR